MDGPLSDLVARLPARLSRIERLGAKAILHTTLPHGGEPALAWLRPEEIIGLKPGSLLHLWPRRVHRFAHEGSRLPCEAIEAEGLHRRGNPSIRWAPRRAGRAGRRLAARAAGLSVDVGHAARASHRGHPPFLHRLELW
jgi:hypothetical protein